MKIGYARVSTFEQKLESQIEVLKEAGAEEVFQEKFTGTNVERPQFNLVFKKLKDGDNPGSRLNCDKVRPISQEH